MTGSSLGVINCFVAWIFVPEPWHEDTLVVNDIVLIDVDLVDQKIVSEDTKHKSVLPKS